MRRKRIKIPGATYDCEGTVNRFLDELEQSEVKKLMLKTIKEAKMLYHFLLLNFVVLNNNVRLIVSPLENEDLSEIMKWLFGTFAKRWNDMHHIRGHFFYDRFKSFIIYCKNDFLKSLKDFLKNIKALKLSKVAVKYEYSGFASIKEKDFSLVDPFPDDYEFVGLEV